MNTELGLMNGCFSVFRLQSQANLQAKQWNKTRKNGIGTRIFSENISVNPRCLCAVCCACWRGLFNPSNCITDVSVACTWKSKNVDCPYFAVLYQKSCIYARRICLLVVSVVHDLFPATNTLKFISSLSSSSYLSWSRATCWPVPVSRIQKSLQRSTMIPSASWGVVFRYPG